MDYQLCCCCFVSKQNYLNCLQNLPDGQIIATVLKFHLHTNVILSQITKFDELKLIHTILCIYFFFILGRRK